MSKSNEEIDKIIHDALSKEEAAFYDQLGEQSLVEMAIDVYKGKDRWIKILAFCFSIVFFGLFVFSAIKFFQAEDLKEMIRWIAVGFFSFGTNMALKIWQWMQMDKNAIIREIRRLELQLSVLAKSNH